MALGDPGMEAVRRSENYPGLLWAARFLIVAIAVVLTALFFSDTKVGLAVALLAVLVVVVSFVAYLLALEKVCAEHPGSIPRLVKASANAGIQMDLFRRKPPLGSR
jgi:hypothetical protein